MTANSTPLPYFTNLYVCAGVFMSTHQGKKVNEIFFVKPTNQLPYVWHDSEAFKLFPLTRHHSHLYRVSNTPGKPLTFILAERGNIERKLIRYERTNHTIDGVFPLEEFTIDDPLLPEKMREEIREALKVKAEELQASMTSLTVRAN